MKDKERLRNYSRLKGAKERKLNAISNPRLDPRWRRGDTIKDNYWDTWQNLNMD